MKKEYTKSEMQDMVGGESDDLMEIESSIIDTTRWATVHSIVFKDVRTGRYYESYFNRGATEMQDESPYEYDNDIIEVQEVVQKEVTTTKWVRKED
ncbi:hypothetical protein KAR91_65515 [Candidatus Pacearchaeota archaeon]|nr:hypothetical protein [Candidatus Pacearchaeota archaeon]